MQEAAEAEDGMEVIETAESAGSFYSRWAATYGGFSTDEAYSIQQTSDGGYIMAGETSSFGTRGGDFWVLKLGPDGSIDHSCGFIKDTNISGKDSGGTIQNTNASVSDRNATPQNSFSTVKDTNVSANVLCRSSL